MMIGEEAASFACRRSPQATGSIPGLPPPVERSRWPPTPPPRSQFFERLSLAQVAGSGWLIVLLPIVVTALLARDRPSPDLLSTAPTETTVPSVPHCVPKWCRPGDVGLERCRRPASR